MSIVSIASAQSCDLRVVPGGGIDAYQARENRCEGRYAQNVANRINLRVVGYHASRLTDDLLTAPSISLAVRPDAVTEEFRLRVTSLKPRLYYQMDTAAFSTQGKFDWPLDILRKIPDAPRAHQLAALACVEACNSAFGKIPVLAPVSFGDIAVDPYGASITILADTELASLKASFWVDGNTVFAAMPVGGPYLPAHSPHTIRLGERLGRDARILISAETRRGTPQIFEAELLLPAPTSKDD